MLLRSPLALFVVNGRDGPKGWVAGVLTDCLSVNMDNWGNWKVLGPPCWDRQDKQGQGQRRDWEETNLLIIPEVLKAVGRLYLIWPIMKSQWKHFLDIFISSTFDTPEQMLILAESSEFKILRILPAKYSIQLTNYLPTFWSEWSRTISLLFLEWQYRFCTPCQLSLWMPGKTPFFRWSCCKNDCVSVLSCFLDT